MIVVGVNHDTAPIQVREHFSLSGERLSQALSAAREHTAECVILSTCNRLEVYALLRRGSTPEAMLSSIFGETFDKICSHTYLHTSFAAVKQLCTVVSGIDSLILGETQILGQVQRAWQVAHRAGAAGPVLSQLFHRAVALGKRVHSETPISRQPASISYAAVVLAKQIFGQTLRDRHVLVIGTGEVGEGVARCLYEHGLHATVVAHRQLEKAHNVARRYEAEVASWDELPQRLMAADVVISSTSAPHTILQRQQVAEAMQGRQERPLYLIDLAVPRDIDPSAAELPGVHLHNIDDLHAVVRTTLQERQSALPAIQAMIDAETARFTEWLRARSTAPTLQGLQAQAEMVIERELRWAVSKLPDLSPKDLRVVEAMAARITGKLLHGPIQWLKAQTLEASEHEYTIEDVDATQLAGLFYREEGKRQDGEG